MAYPFEKMTTEKLNFYYEERVKSNYRDKDTNHCRKKITGNKLRDIFRKLQAKRLRERNF